MSNENNPMDFSGNDPITEAAGIEAVLGMINPKELGQVEQDSVDETESEIIEDNDNFDGVGEEPDQTDDIEASESDEAEPISDIELDDGEYEYLVSAKQFLNDNGLDDIDKIKSGILMQGDYTRKTQALSEERKAFESERDQSLQKAAEMLEVAQAMVYGQRPTHTTQELVALKDSDPLAYEQALEARVLYEQKQSEIDEVAKNVTAQYQQQQQEKLQTYTNEQAQLLVQLEPGFADETIAQEKVSVMNEYWQSIGGNLETLAGINDAMALKVLHDAAMANSAQKQVSQTKEPKKKTASKTVIRKGASKSRAQKQAAAAKEKRAKSFNKDGSIDKRAAVDLILDSFNR